MAFANFWSLVLPGSHDSFTYTFKNYLPPQIKVMIQTQSLSITEQLNLGVRYFDIRLCSWQENILKERVYYTSHSCLCTPIESVLGQIKEFLMIQTSEIVVLSLRADYFPMNLDLFTGNTDIVHTLDIKDKHHKSSLRDFAESYFQDTIGIISEITPTTRVKDLQMANQRVLIFVEYEASVSQTISSNPIYLYSSWDLTQSTDTQDNHALCTDWLKRRPVKTIDYWKTLDHQVTFESQNILEIAKDLFYYSDGLKGMALASNQLIREYLGNSTNSDSIMKVNAITMDFADKETIESIINANFKYL
ncbi:hypothetical protein FGO68_gene13006 [Halteria grandinella]|uniref:Phosphatidylinositol-specific phospholipase C X domain-containing protein n=1 Tax=Halteria grandinella TaxID=5974 RepID=A0A8J8NU25_HALGN|nr:hypothetical protein FGO68_gene13006 [Halteria grandinella]